MSEWQPIETAPKDGTFIRVWRSDRPGYEPALARWDARDQWWEIDARTYYGDPNLWMPEPPK